MEGSHQPDFAEQLISFKKSWQAMKERRKQLNPPYQRDGVTFVHYINFPLVNLNRADKQNRLFVYKALSAKGIVDMPELPGIEGWEGGSSDIRLPVYVKDGLEGQLGATWDMLCEKFPGMFDIQADFYENRLDSEQQAGIQNILDDLFGSEQIP